MILQHNINSICINTIFTMLKNNHMKSGFISFFLFLLISYQIQAQQEYNQHEYCSKALTAKKFYPFNHIRSSLLTADYDLTYYRFEWEIDPAVKAIKGTVTPYFKVLSDGFTEINFDFSRALIVDSIVFHGNKLAFSQPSSYILTIQLPGALTRQSIDLSLIHIFPQSRYSHTNPVFFKQVLQEPFYVQKCPGLQNSGNEIVSTKKFNGFYSILSF